MTYYERRSENAGFADGQAQQFVADHTRLGQERTVFVAPVPNEELRQDPTRVDVEVDASPEQLSPAQLEKYFSKTLAGGLMAFSFEALGAAYASKDIDDAQRAHMKAAFLEKVEALLLDDRTPGIRIAPETYRAELLAMADMVRRDLYPEHMDVAIGTPMEKLDSWEETRRKAFDSAVAAKNFDFAFLTLAKMKEHGSAAYQDMRDELLWEMDLFLDNMPSEPSHTEERQRLEAIRDRARREDFKSA